MKVGSLILYRDEKFGVDRVWEVESILLGALGVESLIRVRSLTEAPGADEDGRRCKTTLIPEPMLRNLPIFEMVQTIN